MAARDAGLCWMNTDLPLKQVCITPPSLPVHNPFLDWAPESVALTPDNVPGPISAPAEDPNEVENENEDDVDGGAQELPVDPPVSPLPFQLGPTPPLVKSVVPVGEVKRGYPRGDLTQIKRVSGVYTGPSMYTWPQVVSIPKLIQLLIFMKFLFSHFRTIWISDFALGFLMILTNGFIRTVSTLLDFQPMIFLSFEMFEVLQWSVVKINWLLMILEFTVNYFLIILIISRSTFQTVKY